MNAKLQSLTVSFWVLTLVGVVAASRLHAAPPGAILTVSVTRPDLRPLPNVALQVTGAVIRDALTDENGRAALLDLPLPGAITITPSRSGFRFEPPQLTVAPTAHTPSAEFIAFPTTTDLAISLTTDEPAPLVGAIVNGVATLRNLGPAAATDVTAAFASMPGLTLEAAEATQGRLEFQAYQTLLRLSQLDPGAAVEVRLRFRATLPNANVLTIAMVEEMDQTDSDPLNNSAELFTRPRTAFARLTLAMTIDPVTAKVGETVPVQLTIRNDGPNDATQVALRTYLPPGASLTAPADGLGNSSVVIPRLAPGAELQLRGTMRVRFPGTFPLIANVTYLEQTLEAGAPWPEARASFTVLPAFAQVTLFAFTDPPNPRVGEDVNVQYVARNDGPDAITGLKLFTREDSRLGTALTADAHHPPPPLPGPFEFGDVLPAGSYTYLAFRYSVKAAGDLTNYFTVEYQDQLIPNAQDHPGLYLPIKTLPADIGLSLDATPREITARVGDPVTIDFPVHNDGPQAAHSFFVDYESPGLVTADTDELVHADRVLRQGTFGYIDVVEPNETVLLRKHFSAYRPGLYTNLAQIKVSHERPDLLMPIATETIRLQVLPGPVPDLGIAVKVDKPVVNVGEYAIFIVTVTNRAAQPAFNIVVNETDAVDADFAFETVRSYGPGGDNRVSTASERTIPRLEPGASYSMSRTMRLRKPARIEYIARIAGVGGVRDAELPSWVARTEVTGVQVTGDMAITAIADRNEVKNGDLVTFVITERNASPAIASHIGLYGGVGPGFQMLESSLGNYGYYFDWSRPKDLQSGAKELSEWYEIRSRERAYTFFSAYTVAAGQLTVRAQLSKLDKLDGQAANDVARISVNSAPASARITLRQSTLGPGATVGNFIPFTTEIRNEGPDRVTGLALVESISPNLELSYSASVTGLSGEVVTSFIDSLIRLPPLEPGQNFIWQRSYATRGAGNAWRRVKVAALDQTPATVLPESEATVNVEPAQADLELQFMDAPNIAGATIPTRFTVRIRNLGPATATGVKVAVLANDLTISGLGYGPRASLDWLSWNTFQTQLLPGESAVVGFNVAASQEGAAAGLVRVQQSDQVDPNLGNNELPFALQVGPAPPIPPVLRVRKVRTDFFDLTPIAEIEVDQAALDRVAPFSTFYLDGSSDLHDWESLALVGLLPLAPVTFTDHAAPGVRTRAYRLRF